MALSFDKPVRAVVTGGGGGLGRAFCLELARRGGRLVVADVDLAGAEETAREATQLGCKAIASRCDVADPAQIEALARTADAELGDVDLLINNAGVAVSGPVDQIPLADWEWIMNINLWGVIHGCRVFVPRMRSAGRGHVINVASSAGLLCAPTMAPYNVTKAAVVALSETMAGELRSAGIGVTVVCPTFFRTKIIDSGRNYSAGKAVGQAQKAMDRARMQAPEVARHALDTAAAGRLYALPHPDGAWLWRLKRLNPEAFYTRMMPRYHRRMNRGE